MMPVISQDKIFIVWQIKHQCTFILLNALPYFLICRHILALMHFNENVHRQAKKSKDGKTYMHISYPKYKLGGEVVREVTVQPTYIVSLNL